MNLTNHLLSRGFDPQKYHCYLSEQIMSVPLWDFDKRFVGYQAYNFLGTKNHSKNPLEVKYLTHSSKQTVWGLEYLTGNESLVFLTESVFKAVAIHNIGLPALAMLGSTPGKQLKQELELQNFILIPVGDDDKAGKAFAKAFQYEGFTSPKDLDEMSIEELQKTFSKYL